MKSTMWKSTFREIKQSFGRFAAIMAIVALGVSLFAGLKVTRECMVKTVREYWEKTEFYDYRILSTVGYDEQDVAAMRIKEDVRAAEGAISADILCMLGKGNEIAVKAYSLPQEVNQLVLKAGRLPEGADECVVDSALGSEALIGQKLVLSQTNEEEDLEQFASEEYTIVGIVQSPLYIQFERGNTSLGNGRLSGFVYLPRDGFTIDYYTEIYVKFNEDFELYSDEYTQYIDAKDSDWEQTAQELALERYERVKQDAGEQLADAQKELEEGRQEGEKELEDARQQLEDAGKELEEGEKELEDARQELADARKTLEDKEKELEEAQAQIEAQEQTLEEAEAELDKNLKLWEEQKAQLNSAKGELSSSQAQLTSQSAPVAEQEAKLEAAETELAQKEQELLNQEKLLDANEVKLLALEPFAQTDEEKEEIRQGLQEIAAYRAQIAEGKQQIADAKAQLTAGREALESGKAVISSYQTQINEGNQQLSAGEQELNKAYQQLLAAQIQVAEGRVQLETAKAQLADGRSQIEAGRTELKEGEAKLEDAGKELEEGRKEYEEGLKEYEDGLQEFEEQIADAQEQIADARKTLDELEEPDSYVLGRNTNIGYACFESDSGIVDGIADIFPVFFFAVAALVCITTMNRMVEEQRTQIGVLKALGYSQASIMCKYLFYSGTAAAAGGIFGFLVGTWLFPNVIWLGYNIMYRVDTLEYVFDWRLAVISLAVSMICSIGTTWLSCRYELSEVAAQLMRPKSPKAGQRVLLERVPFIWKRLKFLYKVSYRNIFRYKKRFIMMVIGISGCTALLVTGFGIEDSIVDVADDQYEKIQIYDVGVTFSEDVTARTQTALKEALEEKATEYIIVMEASADLIKDEKVKSLYLVASDEASDITPYLDLHTSKGEPIAYPSEGECIISQNIAEEFELKIGDTVTLQDENRSTMELTVSGININYVFNYIYITTQTYEKLMGAKAPCKTAYINLTEGTDAHRLSAALMKLDKVTSVTVNTDMLDRFNNMMGSMDLIVLVIVLCAAGLAFIVLYNLTNINITERVREIATIKVLGFYRKETASYVFRENVVLTAIGALAGLFLGKYLHMFVMNAVKVDLVTFDVKIKPLSYVYSIILTIAFAWFVNWVMGKKLERISMTESLKSVD